MVFKNRTKYDGFSFSTGLYLSLESGASLCKKLQSALDFSDFDSVFKAAGRF